MAARHLLAPAILLAAWFPACDRAAQILPAPSLPGVVGVRIRGSVQDQGLRPVSDASVEIIAGAFAGRQTVTNLEGRFDFGISTSEAGTVRLQVSKTGYFDAVAPLKNQLVVMLRRLGGTDLEGSYRVRVTAAAECDQLSAELRSRVYTGGLMPSAESAGLFTTRLTGGEFHRGYDTFWGIVRVDAIRFNVSSWDAFNRWLEDQPIIEELPSGGYLSIMGSATTADADGATIVADLQGTVAHCPQATAVTAPYPPKCAVTLIECRSDHHRLRIDR